MKLNALCLLAGKGRAGAENKLCVAEVQLEVALIVNCDLCMCMNLMRICWFDQNTHRHSLSVCLFAPPPGGHWATWVYLSPSRCANLPANNFNFSCSWTNAARTDHASHTHTHAHQIESYNRSEERERRRGGKVLNICDNCNWWPSFGLPAGAC